jgi:hypothetical protein
MTPKIIVELKARRSNVEVKAYRIIDTAPPGTFTGYPGSFP